MKLEGKRVVITGGTSGIGSAFSEAAARAGARVLICGRSGERVEEASRRLGVDGVACDLGDPAQLESLLEAADDRLGGLDVLVHNAGIQRQLLMIPGGETADDGGLCREIEVNLSAPVRLTWLALPMLLEAASNGGAALVFVTSALALAPKASAPVYCASKAGLRSFAKSVRRQLAGHGISVLEVVPPVVDTEMTAGRDEPKIAPQRVAEAIIEGLESGRDEVLIGKARLVSRLIRLAPGFTERLMAET